MGETAPGNEQATTAQPEAAREGNSEPAPAPPGWASEAERDEAIRRTREQREAQEREEEMDRDNDDPGREMT